VVLLRGGWGDTDRTRLEEAAIQERSLTKEWGEFKRRRDGDAGRDESGEGMDTLH
jgi:hypothetical protein